MTKSPGGAKGRAGELHSEKRVRRKKCWKSQGAVCVAAGRRDGEYQSKAVPVRAVKA